MPRAGSNRSVMRFRPVAQPSKLSPRCIPGQGASQRFGAKKRGKIPHISGNLAKCHFFLGFFVFSFDSLDGSQDRSPKTPNRAIPARPARSAQASPAQKPLSQVMRFALAGTATGASRWASVRPAASNSPETRQASHHLRSAGGPLSDRSASSLASVRTKNLARPADEAAVRMQACHSGYVAQSFGWGCRH